ncbi:gamma carbonic anhydrase family protein [Halopiger aswanensis]|uniref:Carbonic anhydrase/acetyltransferase-like protein (Isoleucine patch superfamily) n=1 Tax=Halopiger aswanensis TaxID=148449 RepID=A0A419WID0_9EURY|nr:gamma carbonic anhydrase family protein [Halopiger aswanensis]RKD95207.1 carbonic anhydrase/acetyltransferase-like protein (isoleucine patch superfamily) [Halopiger aswanensis]
MVDSRTYPFEGAEPSIDDAARVSREAVLVGDVEVAAEASVWPGVVLRGDIGPVRIGRQTHVGDNATIHASRLADRVMIGHGAVLNDAVVEEGALVGFNATINTDVTVGSRSVVAAGTVVPDEYEIPSESFVRGVPAEITPLEETTIDPEAIFESFSSGEYTDLAQRHDQLFE